jgi:pimeloyl-ACP methyl ester carboxylesterase
MARIDVDGRHVEFLEQGSGPAVLLLHSTGASGAQWRALVERLAGRFHVIAPDLCGYGASAGWSGRGAFRLADEAAGLAPLLARFETPVHLVGHSYGGAVALHLARTRPERIASLAVYEPVAFHLLREGDAHDTAALREIAAVAAAVVRALASGDYAAGAAHFMDYWSGPGTWAGQPAARQDALAARVAKVALDFEAAMHEAALPSDFARLAVPALLLQGDRSPAPPRRIAQRLARAMPGAAHRIVHGAGHMGPLTHRDEVNEQIVAFLSALEWKDPCITSTPTATPSASKPPSASAGTSTATSSAGAAST